MEYVEAFLVVCIGTSVKATNKWQEFNVTAEIYCPHGAFLTKSEAAKYAHTRPEKTMIVPCCIPKVVG